MLKLRKEINGETPTPKKKSFSPVFPSQINMNLWFFKKENDTPSVVKKSVHKIGVKSEIPHL